MGDFENKVALVTGGSGGVGRAAVVALAQQGAKVVVISRRVAEGQETVELAKQAGGEAIFIQTDITKTTEVKDCIDRIIKDYKQLDYAFNNAGVEGKLSPITDLTVEDWDEVIDTNLKGPWICMKHQIPAMVTQGKGVIVNNASVFGLVGFSNLSPYCASKHGVIGLTKSLALEYANQGIRINAICSGGVETDMQLRLAKVAGIPPKDWKQEMAKLHPIGRLSKAEEIAQVVLFLCSDAASFITGQAFAVDGGWTAQ